MAPVSLEEMVKMENNVRKSDLFWKVLSVVMLIVLVGMVSVIVWQNRERHVYIEGGHLKSNMASLSPALTAREGNVYWVADLAEKCMPYVVNIKTEIPLPQMDSKSKGSAQDKMMQQWEQMLPGPLGQEFQLPDQMQQHPDVPMGGEGSGFIVNDGGYVVTNAHVVADANKFTVKLSDGREFKAKLIGTDTFKDVAVLKIDGAGKLPVAPLGNSDEVRIGEPVIAIGSPLGFQQTVTAGIISTTHRSIEDLGQASDVRRPDNLLQTDAAINRGNSGGPLIDPNGNVIGINQAIARWDSDGFQQIPIEGIGFAIPINAVKTSIDSIIQHGKVVYPGISAKVASLSDYLKVNPNLKTEIKKGVYVESVTVGGPAARAGIAAGDVIVAVDGKDIDTAQGLIGIIQTHKVGERVTMRVARQGGKKLEDVSVVLSELDVSPGY